MFRTLDADKIVTTLGKLGNRIGERFPGAGLADVCAELQDIARVTKARVARISAPNIPLRIGSALVVVCGVGLLAFVIQQIRIKRIDTGDLFVLTQGVEAVVSLLFFIGAGVLFLVTIEARWKRHLALTDLHDLRSIVHVIDMHQLTKDPNAPAVSQRTPSSPDRTLTPYELTRYLDYCSEMLSLTSKVATLYAQGFRDPIVIQAVNDIGQIAGDLNAKIWQKIMIIMMNEPDVASHAFGPASNWAPAPAQPGATSQAPAGDGKPDGIG